MKWIALVLVAVMACSAKPVTRPPTFNVVCLSQGDTLFASDSVYSYEPPQTNWGTDYGWRFAVNVTYWKGKYRKRERLRGVFTVARGEIIQVTGDCVVRRNR